MKYWEGEGCSNSEATKIVIEEFAANPIRPSSAPGLPEGGIVTIVDTYLKSMQAAGGWPWMGDVQSFEAANLQAIQKIEKYRNLICKGQPNYPKRLDDYVYYRMKIELPGVFGKSADDYGMNKETTAHLVHNAKTNLLTIINESNIQSSEKSLKQVLKPGSSACFIATACFGHTDDPTVLIFRIYRENVLRKSHAGRIFIYWCYRFSPALAAEISRREKIRLLIHSILVPIAGFLEKKQKLNK